MKRHLTALAALTVLALPAATGCAKVTPRHHHADVVPVCAHVQHTIAGDYVHHGRRPCVLPSPVVHHHAWPRPTGPSTGTPGIYPATTGGPATTSAPRFSKAPLLAPKPSKAAPPAPARKVAPPAPLKAPSLTKPKSSR